MNLIIFFRNKKFKLSFFAILLISLFPFVANSDCGNVPGTYPVFSSGKLTLEEEFEVNGYEREYEDPFYGNKAVSITGRVSTVSLTLPDLNPPTFPTNSSTTDLSFTSSTTLNNTSEVFYNILSMNSAGITVNFTGGGTVHINQLNINNSDVTLNFAAGTYFIDKIAINGTRATFNTSSTPVIFHIGTEFTIPASRAKLNLGGNVDDFRVFLHSGSKFDSTGSSVDFTGLIYGPSNVSLVKFGGDDNTIRGAIITSGGEVRITGEDSSLTYTTGDQTAIGNISTCDGSGGGGDTPATAFNCVENGADGISGMLYTKTTAQSFTFDIVALQDVSTIETNFASGADHTVSVELVDASSGTCSTYSSLSPAISQNLTFTVTDSGIKASSSMSSSTAYSNVKCRVTDTTDSPSVVGCSTDSFAIRPTSMIISSNLTNASSTGTPKAKAGESFTLTATAITGYSGTPAINNLNIQAHVGAVLTGNISGSFSAADSVTGIATGNAFSYSEVGSLRFATQGIFDDSFTSVDQPGDCTDDFSNTVVAGKVGCKFGNTVNTAYFGRFTPDHFSFISSSITPACATGSYSYMDETFAISYVVEARNNSEGITQNYHYQASGDNYVKASDIAMSAEYIPPSATTSQNLSARLSMTYDPGLWVNGQYQVVNADALFSRITTVDGAYDGLDIGLKVVDDDGIILSAPDMLSSDNTNVACTSLTCVENKIGTTNIRFGRLNMNNSHGSELLPLATPLYTEYFNGTFFVSNTNDSCTSINLTQLQFNSSTNPITIGSGNSTASIANTPLSSAQAGLSFSTPGAGNTGFIDISSDIFIASFPWLSFDWDDDGVHDNSPTARATFGIYKGDSKKIYFREVY